MSIGETSFYVSGAGRSGTKWLAWVLNGDPNAAVFHEILTYADDKAGFLARTSSVMHYIRSVRDPFVTATAKAYAYWRNLKPTVRGEVNSQIRYMLPQILAVHQTARIFAIVRDGRDVVRSMWGRNHYRNRNTGSLAIEPLDDDPWREQWDKFGRFSRLCWWWQDGVQAARDVAERTLVFERLVTDYDYLAEFADSVGVSVPLARFRRASGIRMNATREHAMPAWPEWSEFQTERFWAICGHQMRECGYEGGEA